MWFNKVAKQLYWNHTSAWCSHVNLLQIFRITFCKKNSGRLLLLKFNCYFKIYYLWKMINEMYKKHISSWKIFTWVHHYLRSPVKFDIYCTDHGISWKCFIHLIYQLLLLLKDSSKFQWSCWKVTGNSTSLSHITPISQKSIKTD